MNNLKEKIRKVFYERNGVDIDCVDFMDMPDSIDAYNFDRTIGNLNLMEGRVILQSEVDEIVNRFLNIPLP